MFFSFRPLQLSLWANKRPVAARWLILACRIILGYYAFYWGAVLADIDKGFSNTAFIISALAFLIGYIFYPKNKKNQNNKNYFLRQKTCDGILVLSSCVFWLAAGNYTIKWQPNNSPETIHAEVMQSAIGKNGKALPDPKWEHVEILKKAKKKRTGFLKKIKKWRVGFIKKLKARALFKLAKIKSISRKLDSGTIVLLVVASLAIFVFLGYLTAFASCSLTCNGQEGAGTLVAMVGCAAIIGLIYWMWSATIKKRKYTDEKFELEDENMPNKERIISEKLATPQIEITNPTVQLCIETDDPKGMAGISLTHNGESLMSNIQIGRVPICIDLALFQDVTNSIKVQGADGPVKLSIEDGKVTNRVTLPMLNNQTEGVDLILKK